VKGSIKAKANGKKACRHQPYHARASQRADTAGQDAVPMSKQQQPGPTAAGRRTHPAISAVGAHQQTQQQGKVSKVKATSKVKAMPLQLPHPASRTRSGRPAAAPEASGHKGTNLQAGQRAAVVPDVVPDGNGSRNGKRSKDGGTSLPTTDDQQQRPGKRARVQGGGRAQEEGIHRETPGKPGGVTQVEGTGAEKVAGQLHTLQFAGFKCQAEPMAMEQQPQQQSQPDKPPAGKKIPASLKLEAPEDTVGGSGVDEGTKHLTSKHPKPEVTLAAGGQANRGSNSGSAGLGGEGNTATAATDEGRGRAQLLTTASDGAVRPAAALHPVQPAHAPPAVAATHPASSPPSSKLPASAVPAFCSSHLQQHQVHQGVGSAVPTVRPNHDVPLPLPKRVSRLMSRLLDPSIGPISAGEMASVLGCLHSNGSPAALCLATALSSIPVGRGASGEACSALTRAVFSWQVSCL
jgi:hypothetical protein